METASKSFSYAMPILFLSHKVKSPPQNPSFPLSPMQNSSVNELSTKVVSSVAIAGQSLATRWRCTTCPRATGSPSLRPTMKQPGKQLQFGSSKEFGLIGTWTNVTSCFNQGRSWTTFSAGSCTGFVWGLSMRLETPFLVALSFSIDCNFFMYAYIWCLNLLEANAQNSQFGKLSDQASPPTRL